MTDDRPRCATCTKRLGRDEARVGTCLWCQRIHTANEKARNT